MAAAMTNATQSEKVMLPSFSASLLEFAFKFEGEGARQEIRKKNPREMLLQKITKI